jgi:hypothetical protein
MLTFSDLGIRDISRKKSNPWVSYYNISADGAYTYQGSVAPYPNIIIATEKDTVYSIISDLSKLLGLSDLSCKGQNSLGAMESLIKGICAEHDELEFDEIIILTLTDYDPAGYYIAEALEGQAIDILNAIGYDFVNVRIKRLGITPKQLNPQQVEANKYTPKPANMDKWMRRTGGINGERKGLELDALTSNQIRQIFVDGISPFIDPDEYKDFVKEAYLKKEFLEASEGIISKAWEIFKDEFMDETQVSDFNIIDLAVKGERTIDIEEYGQVNFMNSDIENAFDNAIKDNY